MIDVKKLVADCKDRVIQTRRELHRIPEIGFAEEKTSAYIAEYLKREGLKVQTGIAKYGVVGLLETGKPGPTLLIRADIDALPIVEDTGLPFASMHPGVMHACGHDAHMAMALGAATILNSIKEHLKGTIKFVFQPAEEGPGGAKPMIEAGVMENPHVDYAIGCHVWPAISEGCIGVKTGPAMAAADSFTIKIIGKGGHGAMPHLSVDALEIGVQVVNALQRLVSRQIDPLKPAVVTVASFHAGTAFNIIPGEAELRGTTRTFDPDIWDSWQQRFETIIRGVCDSMGATFEMNYERGYPPLANDAAMAEMVRQCAAEAVGADCVIADPAPTMGGEDMAYFLEKAKGCFFFVGVGKEGKFSVHHPKFDFNEEALLPGVETFCRIALHLLK